MITVVVTEQGNVKGYLLEDIYIKKDLLKYFTPTRSLKGSKVFGKSFGSSIKVRNKIYKGVLSYLSSKKVNEVIRAFTLNGIPLNDIIFYPCKASEIKFEGMSELWEVIADMNSRNHKCFAGVSSEGKPLAYMLSYQDLFKGDSFYINMFETVTKRKGVGTLVVNTLRTYGKEIRGMSIITAIDFWKKLGARFTDAQHFVL